MQPGNEASVFVGRAAELAELRAALERAKSRKGGVVLVAGEPGIGKSELADRVAAEAIATGSKVLSGRSWEGEGAPPYWPWAQIIRDHVRELAPADLESTLGGAAPYLAQIVPEIRDRLPSLPAPSPLDSEQARFRLFDSITTFFKGVAAEQPLLLVLDDLHWADKPSLLLLQFLAHEIGDARLLVVATYRDVEVSRGHPLAEVLPSLRRERSVERILLRGLPEQDVRAMLAALRGEKLPDSLAHAISRETEGNPFFVQEILRHLIEEGVLGEGAGWTSRTRLEEIGLPESVRDVIGRRLGRLSEACTKVLTVGAVLGREFALDALERVAGVDKERLLEVLDEAFVARVVEEAPQRLGRYRFSHALVRESLYEGLKPLERFRSHLRVAESLEALQPRTPGPHLAELAHHYRQALPGGDVDKAVDYAMRAGDYATEQLAYEEAAIHYERALEALDLRAEPEDRLRCELLMKHGDACWGAGLDTTKSLRQAADLAERLGDSEMLARAAIACAGNQTGIYVMVEERLQLELLVRALSRLEERDSALRAQVMSRIPTVRIFIDLGTGSTVLDRWPDGASLAREAVEMARRVGDKRALAYVLATTIWALGPDEHEQVVARLEEVRSLAEENGDERVTAEVHLWKARYYVETGNRSAADREMEIQEQYAAKSRSAYHRWQADLGRAGRLIVEGKFDEAEAALKSLAELGNPTDGAIGAVSGCLNFLNEHRGGLGAVDLERIVRHAAQNPRVFLWRVSVAARYAMHGKMEEARREFESLAANAFSDIPRDMMWLFIMARLADLAIAFNDTRRAAILYELLLPYAGRILVTGGLAASRGAVARVLGGLATVLCRYDDAERHFERALEMHAQMRDRVWTVHTQHDYARMLVARDGPGDRQKAAALSAEARAAAQEIGMKPLLANLGERRAAAGFDEPETIAPARAPTAGPSVFRREGDFWMIVYDGRSLRLKDAKGLQYIAHLVHNEGREVHVADLAAGNDGKGPVDRGNAGEILDAQARVEYRQRISDLERELDEATQWGDTGRAARTREEIEFLKDELSAAFGLGGRSRRAAGAEERARKAVASRMQETIGKIRKEHPVLAIHLENSIRKGVFCCYAPERSVDWQS